MPQTKEKINKIFSNKDVRAIVGTVVGSTIEAFCVVWILEYGNFFATGLTGVAQVINKLLVLISDNLFISVGVLYFILNIPLLIISFKGVSKRFAIFSGLCVILQSIFIVVFEYIRDISSFSPFAVFGEDRLMLAIIGGLISGASSGLMLRSGGSSGGIDILSQYLRLKKRANFAFVSSITNAVILIAGFFLEDITCVAYTAIRLILYILVSDRINNIYHYIKISIVTTKPEELRVELLNRFSHSMTLYKVTGGYSLTEKTEIEIIASRYEVDSYRKLVHSIDPEAFMTFSKINKIDGRFNQSRIA